MTVIFLYKHHLPSQEKIVFQNNKIRGWQLTTGVYFLMKSKYIGGTQEFLVPLGAIETT